MTVDVHRDDDRPAGRGGRGLRFLGRRLEYTYEVVELVPADRLVMRTAEGPLPMETTYTWAPAGDGTTRMTLRNRGEPAGFSKVAAPLMAACAGPTPRTSPPCAGSWRPVPDDFRRPGASSPM